MAANVDPLSSRLRLFLSVDMVGSTAFKQSNQAAFNSDAKAAEVITEPWFSPIAQFYREIERLFAKEWALYCSAIAPKHKWPTNDPPRLWKSAGDELIYTKVLNDHRESLACLCCWINAVREYRIILRAKYPNLDLKSGAWLAGFPITNTEVVFRTSVGNMSPKDDDDDAVFSNLSLIHEYYNNPGANELTRDFIGPSIDTGFRICTLATPRKLVVSVDLALMVVHAIRGSPADIEFIKLSIHYDGRVALKGVLGDSGYPIFWIDMSASAKLDSIEDKLLGISPENTDNIKEFCEEFILENTSKIIIPYIQGNSDMYFCRPPDHHEVRLKFLREYWDNEVSRRIDESKAFTETAGGTGADEASIEKFLVSMNTQSNK